MTKYSELLRQGAGEVGQFRSRLPNRSTFELRWLEALAASMERASILLDEERVEHEIDSIARSIVDSGPIDQEFAPSFFCALDLLQRARKRAS